MLFALTDYVTCWSGSTTGTIFMYSIRSPGEHQTKIIPPRTRDLHEVDEYECDDPEHPREVLGADRILAAEQRGITRPV